MTYGAKVKLCMLKGSLHFQNSAVLGQTRVPYQQHLVGDVFWVKLANEDRGSERPEKGPGLD